MTMGLGARMVRRQGLPPLARGILPEPEKRWRHGRLDVPPQPSLFKDPIRPLKSWHALIAS